MPRTAKKITDEKMPTVAPQFEAVRSPRAFEEIASQIRNELANGRLKVGSRLPAERTLAVQFGVSRNTLREALRSLENAGLIRLLKGASGGAFISEGSAGVIVNGMVDLYHIGTLTPSQLTEARIWIEAIAVREACARATPADIQLLRDNLEQALQASKAGEFDNRVQLNLEFHRIIARMTGNPFMVIVMDGLITVLEKFVRSIGDYDNTFVYTSRKRFIKHMEDKNTVGAMDEMESSLKRLEQGYLSRLAAGSAGTKKAPAVKNSTTKTTRKPRAPKKPAA